ncbi:MAG TPA: polyprenyl synthetase family protein [Chlamydiales bacterium]|nr:polyprenyl synthetase family protein [Chlamydiales bacterium]
MSIETFRTQIERELRLFIEEMGEKNRLRDACEYALTNGGKRLRPILVLMIADALGLGFDVFPAALSVEFFHTASLIADDLPCMDDDDLRRNRPSLHKVFGESVAILASYTLIAAGYGGIHRNSGKMKASSKADAIAVLCLEAATRCAGIKGATNGQFLDLYPPDASLETIRKIIFQKTVTLFEISFVFGWLFGGGSCDLLEKVRKCAYHLGMAFQIADDLQDRQQDGNEMNIASACGAEGAARLFEEEVASFILCLKELKLWTKSFQEVVEWLRRLAPQPV